MLKPVELEVELFCLGMRIDESCHVDEDGRRISRTRAGLGSGLELVLPSPRKKIWVNVPVVEAFAAKSPFLLMKTRRGYVLCLSLIHISEPTRLGMISYAVFCLKKKKQ